MNQTSLVSFRKWVSGLLSFVFLIAVGLCVTPLYAATGENAVKKYPYERILDKNESSVSSEQEMKLEDGKISARFVSTPLKEVMAELGQLCDVEISWSGQESGEPISVWFTDKAPDKAVQEILDGRSYVLAYKSINNQGTLAKVKILDSPSPNEYSNIEPYSRQPAHMVGSEGRQVRQLSTKNTRSDRGIGKTMEIEESANIDDMRSQIETMPLDMLIEMADEQKRALRMQKKKYPRLKKRRISDASKILQNFIGKVR